MTEAVDHAPVVRGVAVKIFFVVMRHHRGATARRANDVFVRREDFDESLGDLSEEESALLESLDEACAEAADAAVEAAGQCDRRRQEAFDAVDALCGATVATAPEIPPLLFASPAAPHSGAANERALSFPCTLSTVSTAALARGLAGDAALPLSAAPRSPFSAPRKLGPRVR